MILSLLSKKKLDGRCIRIVTKCENGNDISLCRLVSLHFKAQAVVIQLIYHEPGCQDNWRLRPTLFRAWIFRSEYGMTLISGPCSK